MKMPAAPCLLRPASYASIAFPDLSGDSGTIVTCGKLTTIVNFAALIKMLAAAVRYQTTTAAGWCALPD
jgi:hypothetical protein